MLPAAVGAAALSAAGDPGLPETLEWSQSGSFSFPGPPSVTGYHCEQPAGREWACCWSLASLCEPCGGLWPECPAGTPDHGLVVS